MSLVSTQFIDRLKNDKLTEIPYVDFEDYQEENTMEVLDNWDKYRLKMEKFIQNTDFVWKNYGLPDKTLTTFSFCKIKKDNCSCVFESNELNIDKCGSSVKYNVYLEYYYKGLFDYRLCGMSLFAIINHIDENEPYEAHKETYYFDCAKNMYKTLKKIIETE